MGGTATGAGNVISGNKGQGVWIRGAGTTGNLVQGNLIGTTPSGTGQSANAGSGVLIGSGATSNTIGGNTAGARNIISGNSSNGVTITDSGTSGNVVEGNYIGINSAGTAKLGNTIYGVRVDSAGNTIGGIAAIAGTGAGNVISGNGQSGLLVGASSLVEGNIVGLNAAGSSSLGNGFRGIDINVASSVTIGGTAGGAGNVISGNAGTNIQVSGGSNITIQGNIVGLDITGTAVQDNPGDGIQLNGTISSVVGGTVTGARNIISGNRGGDGGIYINAGATGDVVQGNYIGTDITGTLALGNTNSGVSIDSATNNTIGGTAAGAGNVISGNFSNGVSVSSSGATGNTIAGNYIGTDYRGTGLVTQNTAWYKGEGNANDNVGSNNGTLNGGVGYVAGEVGQAFNFPGNVGDYVRIPSSAALSPTAALTVDMWVKGNAPSGNTYLLAKGPAGGGNASYGMYTLSGGLQFYVYTTGNGIVTSPDAGTAIWNNAWHHIAGVFDGSSVRLYVDGVEVGTGTPTAKDTINYPTLGTTPDLFIGNYPLVPGFYPNGNLPFKGQLDEVGIYSRPCIRPRSRPLPALVRRAAPANLGTLLAA